MDWESWTMFSWPPEKKLYQKSLEIGLPCSLLGSLDSVPNYWISVNCTVSLLVINLSQSVFCIFVIIYSLYSISKWCAHTTILLQNTFKAKSVHAPNGFSRFVTCIDHFLMFLIKCLSSDILIRNKKTEATGIIAFVYDRFYFWSLNKSGISEDELKLSKYQMG